MRWRNVVAGVVGALMVVGCSASSTSSSSTTLSLRDEVARRLASTTTTQNPSVGCQARALAAFDVWLGTANSIKDSYNADSTSFETARDAVVTGAVTMRQQHTEFSSLAGGMCMPPVKALADQAGEVTAGYEALGAAMTARDSAAIDAAIAQTSAAEAALFDRYCSMAACAPSGPGAG